MTSDFSIVTERPGRKIGREQFQVIARRYALAVEYVGGKRVLEVGCGAGFGLGAIAQRAAFTVAGDVSAVNLEVANATYRARRNLAILRFDAHALPFGAQSFDVILAMAMIYYVDIERFLHEAARVLRYGGWLLCCTPNRDSPRFRPSRLSTAYHAVPDLVERFHRAGFTPNVLGAFPVSNGHVRVRQWLTVITGTVLSTLSFAPAVREAVRGIIAKLFSYELCSLEGSLTPEDLRRGREVEVVPLPPHGPDTTYGVIYLLAQRRLE